jgi:exodeoxyribonuclease VII small subunit
MAKKEISNEKEIDLEKALKDLEKSVEKLSGEDISLEAAMTEYEKGVKTAKEALSYLQTTETKIKKLVADQGELKYEEFEND